MRDLRYSLPSESDRSLPAAAYKKTLEVEANYKTANLKMNCGRIAIIQQLAKSVFIRGQDLLGKMSKPLPAAGSDGSSVGQRPERRLERDQIELEGLNITLSSWPSVMKPSSVPKAVDGARGRNYGT